MQKYFDLLLELLRPQDDELIVEERNKLSAAANKLEEKWTKNLKIFHKYWFIFKAYEDLLNEKIQLDEFLATWDITSNRKIYENDESSLSIINKIINWKLNWDNNTLFILDTISFLVLPDNDKKIVQKRSKEHNNEIIFC